MKRILGAALVLLSGLGVTAEAVYLDVGGYLLDPLVAYTEKDGQTNPGFYAGGRSWQWDEGGWSYTPMYCMDLEHRFEGRFEAERYTVPPDPHPGSYPYNTAYAAWLYNEYGDAEAVAGLATTWEKRVRLAAMQVAIWEVTHDLDWGTTPPTSNWLWTGDFLLYGTNNNADMVDEADELLGFLQTEINQGFDYGGQAYWYEPDDWPGGEAAQGHVGPIPEPGVVVMLGVGLLSMAAVTWSKRRQR